MQDNRKNTKFMRFIFSAVLIISPWIIIFAIKNNIDKKNLSTHDIKIVSYKADTLPKQVDHSQFEILKQQFNAPEEVTAACLTCHNERHKEVMAGNHWRWDRETVRENGEKTRIGKKNIINNFCIATNTNSWKCTSCHAGYGYKDPNYDFTDSTKIDCMACHDNTGTYEKQPLGSGYPVSKKENFEGKTYFPPNYSYIAQNVGSPEINNCGKCHFYGGGGDNVKHGDLSSDLFHATKEMDVHMDEHGNNMNCVSCHKTERHVMLGKAHSVSNNNENRLYCTQCHTETPHQNSTLNTHTDRIACQTCHIPVYAKGVPTKMLWDWSEAGKLTETGKRITEKDSLGFVTYNTPKGRFEWATNVEPEYAWFNGNAYNYVYGDKIQDTTKVFQINKLYGSFDDPTSKIIPMKVHRGKQPFDPENMILIVPHIYGHDSAAYQENLDWTKAAAHGMRIAGLPFSGKYSFIATEMYWPLNHMVSTSDKALTCTDCHSRESRLKNVAGFYMPGRDRSMLFDIFGIAMIAIAIMGVIIHGTIRYIKKDCIACDVD